VEDIVQEEVVRLAEVEIGWEGMRMASDGDEVPGLVLSD
jgi:hypothetical protein